MTGLTSLLTDSVKSLFGHPVQLERALQKHGDISVDLTATKSADAKGVIRWHELGEKAHMHRPDQGWLLGWKMKDGIWQSYDHFSYNLSNLLVEETEEDWGCDIREVEGLSASKATLKDFSSLDDLAVRECFDLIQNVSLEGLESLLGNREIRINKGTPTTDHLKQYAWDGRLHLINDGGSHHFAAARYIAGQLNTPVPLSVKLEEINLSHKAVEGLREEFALYAIKSCPILLGDMMDALRAYDAAFCLMDLPAPFLGEKVIMLPKDVARSVEASKFLAQAGLPELGAHLEELCEKQTFRL